MNMETGKVMDGRRSDLGKNGEGGVARMGDTHNGKHLELEYWEGEPQCRPP